MSDTTFDDFLLRAEEDRELAERQAQSRPSRDVALLLIGIRSRMNLSQAAFARQVGVTPSYISQLESGNANPGICSLSKLLRRVGVSLRFEAVIAVSPGLAGERVEAPVREEARHSTLSERILMS